MFSDQLLMQPAGPKLSRFSLQIAPWLRDQINYVSLTLLPGPNLWARVCQAPRNFNCTVARRDFGCRCPLSRPFSPCSAAGSLLSSSLGSGAGTDLGTPKFQGCECQEKCTTPKILCGALHQIHQAQKNFTKISGEVCHYRGLLLGSHKKALLLIQSHFTFICFANSQSLCTNFSLTWKINLHKSLDRLNHQHSTFIPILL